MGCIFGKNSSTQWWNTYMTSNIDLRRNILTHHEGGPEQGLKGWSPGRKTTGWSLILSYWWSATITSKFDARCPEN